MGSFEPGSRFPYWRSCDNTIEIEIIVNRNSFYWTHLCRLFQVADIPKVKLFGTQEAAKRLGVTPTRIATMIRAGIIKAQKVGRSWIIDSEELARVQKLSRPPGRPRQHPGSIRTKELRKRIPGNIRGDSNRHRSPQTIEAGTLLQSLIRDVRAIRAALSFAVEEGLRSDPLWRTLHACAQQPARVTAGKAGIIAIHPAARLRARAIHFPMG
jgi:excisionase family DNA binding protein